MSAINPVIATFITEAREQLEGLEALLLDLESDPAPEKVDAVFRALHTVKGSGSMFGFTVLARFTHHFEDAFDRVREGRLSVTPSLVDLSLKARDHMTALLELGGDGPEAEAMAAAPDAAALLAALARLVGGDHAAEAAPTDAEEKPELAARARRWEIRFRPAPDALRNGMRPDLLLAELAALGTAGIVVDASELSPLESLDPTLSQLAWTVTLETAESRAAIDSVFVFADDADLSIKEVADEGAAPVEAGLAAAAAPARTEDAAPAVAKAPRDPGGKRSSAGAAADQVRIPAARLDEIMDRLGELVIAQARLRQIAEQSAEPELAGVVEEVDRLVSGLRDSTLSIRMLPIETVFGKFRRVVRDLSSELGKDVDLIVEGGETEIDKTVLDKLSEPLVHMIRNSMDHGIEQAERRRAAGKPAQGRLLLSARQEGGEVLISIEDDGAGLDAEAIRAKALERGLLTADSTPTEAELHQLIFAPGFSTAKQLSSVSGRGVGMDAVRTAVDALRGSIEVLSRSGSGTRVTLRLPVTLAIVEGLLIRLGEAAYVLPLSVVEECVEFDPKERSHESGRSVLLIREHLVPFLDLADAFGEAASEEPRRRVVIARADGKRIGLVVDDILGQHQTVIKALGPLHREVEGFAGATILGDGSVALIIDVASLSRRALAARRDAA
ncbi:MAG: chemotaxis protein CheA [Pikeienuella sp.]|uniref:chemotaxis protein CheA n=1 Tax=Pikeienuella sp. TaxID=2831957 RepID=UPI00391C26B7